MSRIFAVLSFISILLMAVAILFGLRVGDYNPTYKKLLETEYELKQSIMRSSSPSRTAEVQRLHDRIDSMYLRIQPLKRRATQHMLIGILASLVTVLVNSISVTYFIGTGRWCKEVVETYKLDASLVDQSRRIKRRTFPWSLAGIATVLVIVMFGAAADPGTLRQTTSNWVLPHFLASSAGTALVALSYTLQVNGIRSNSDVIQQILNQVQHIRAARGLDVNETG